jgi:hypothetical protein
MALQHATGGCARTGTGAPAEDGIEHFSVVFSASLSGIHCPVICIS